MWPTLGPVCPQEWLHSAVEILLARNQGDKILTVQTSWCDFGTKLNKLVHVICLNKIVRIGVPSVQFVDALRDVTPSAATECAGLAAVAQTFRCCVHSIRAGAGTLFRHLFIRQCVHFLTLSRVHLTCSKPAEVRVRVAEPRRVIAEGSEQEVRLCSKSFQKMSRGFGARSQLHSPLPYTY